MRFVEVEALVLCSDGGDDIDDDEEEEDDDGPTNHDY